MPLPRGHETRAMLLVNYEKKFFWWSSEKDKVSSKNCQTTQEIGLEQKIFGYVKGTLTTMIEEYAMIIWHDISNN